MAIVAFIGGTSIGIRTPAGDIYVTNKILALVRYSFLPSVHPFFPPFSCIVATTSLPFPQYLSLSKLNSLAMAIPRP